jgi:predicted Rossmann-fold nucleotide-binding protein
MENNQKIKLTVYGARHTDQHKSFDALEKAQLLGEKIAQHHCIATIPASTGFPFWVAKGVQSASGTVVSFSPAANEEEHIDVYDLPTKYTDITIYSGFGYAGSDLLLARSSDAIIFGYGGVETIHEFWVAFQEDKPIGILKGDWDTDEVLYSILKDNEEFDHSRVVFDEDPNRLIEQLIKMVKDRK